MNTAMSKTNNKYDYKGYIKEALLYPICIYKPEKKNGKKFIIFGVPRSGSTLLVSLIDVHPEIHCEGELWSHRLLFPEHFVDCRVRLNKKDIFGFKLLVTHFERQNVEDPNLTISKFYENGFQIISLVRRNLYRAALSTLYAEYSGKTHLRQTDKKSFVRKMLVDPETLLQKLDRFDYLSKRHTQSLEGIPHLDISYEDDLMDESCHQNTIDRIFGEHTSCGA